MNYENLILTATWVLEVHEVTDIFFGNVPYSSVIDCNFIKGNRDVLSQYLRSNNSGMLFIDGCFKQQIQIEEPASLPVRAGPGDIELASPEPFANVFQHSSRMTLIPMILD